MTSEPDIHVYTNYLLKDLLLEHGESVDKLTFDGMRIITKRFMRSVEPN